MSKKMTQKVLAGTTALVVAGQASAYDWAAVTGAIDFSGELTAIAAVIGLLASVTVVMVGGKKVLQALRG